MEYCQYFRNTSSTGSDGISSSIINATFNEIVNPLTLIFNVSLSTGVVPDILKIAKVVPIHKSDDKGLVTTTGQYWSYNLCFYQKY